MSIEDYVSIKDIFTKEIEPPKLTTRDHIVHDSDISIYKGSTDIRLSYINNYTILNVKIGVARKDLTKFMINYEVNGNVVFTIYNPLIYAISTDVKNQEYVWLDIFKHIYANPYLYVLYSGFGSICINAFDNIYLKIKKEYAITNLLPNYKACKIPAQMQLQTSYVYKNQSDTYLFKNLNTAVNYLYLYTDDYSDKIQSLTFIDDKSYEINLLQYAIGLNNRRRSWAAYCLKDKLPKDVIKYIILDMIGNMEISENKVIYTIPFDKDWKLDKLCKFIDYQKNKTRISVKFKTPIPQDGINVNFGWWTYNIFRCTSCSMGYILVP